MSHIAVPPGFPPIPYPEDNAFSPARWQLGKTLFFDKALSLDSSISCGSCHQPQLAFSDSVALSTGVSARAGDQNAPTLANVAWHPYYTRAGGVRTLEMQVLVPIQEHNEFNFNIVEIAKRLQNNTQYQTLSRKAYQRDLDYYVITRALANFERSLVSGDSRYDRYKRGAGELTAEELRGMNLFFSPRTGCSACHNGFNFTNYAFENNGLYARFQQPGRLRVTEDSADFGKFKVPTLRNVALTAPYMHDGSLKTLRAVVEHYSSGGQAIPQKSKLLRPLHLTENEKKELIAFLGTLTDPAFVTRKQLRQATR